MSHKGQVTMRTYPGGVMFLCPLGHVVESIRDADWSGSLAESRADRVVECEGAE